MTNPRSIQYLLARLSLAVLAAGFTLLGLLVLTKGPHEASAGAPVLEDNCRFIGSIVSILTGVIFLIAGWVSWSRTTTSATAQSTERQRGEKDSGSRLFPDRLAGTPRSIRNGSSSKVSILYSKNSLSQNALAPVAPNGNQNSFRNIVMTPNAIVDRRAGVDA
jgi:hypothetical protein